METELNKWIEWDKLIESYQSSLIQLQHACYNKCSNYYFDQKKILEDQVVNFFSKYGYTKNDLDMSSFVQYAGSSIVSCPVKIIFGTVNFGKEIGLGLDIIDLNELEYIKDNAYFNYCNPKLTSLKKIKYIGKDARFRNSSIKDLGDLLYIGGYVDFSQCNIKNFGHLQYIGGDVYFGDNKDLERLYHQQFKNGKRIKSLTKIIKF